jgi:hypothetical protein
LGDERQFAASELGELAAAQLIIHSAKVAQTQVNVADDVLADLPRPSGFRQGRRRAHR